MRRATAVLAGLRWRCAVAAACVLLGGFGEDADPQHFAPRADSIVSLADQPAALPAIFAGTWMPEPFTRPGAESAPSMARHVWNDSCTRSAMQDLRVLVIGPAPPASDGGFVLDADTLLARHAALPAGTPLKLLLRGGLYRINAPLRIAAGLSGVAIAACAGEHARIVAADGWNGPLISIEGVHGVRVSHLDFVGHPGSGDAIRLRDADCNGIVANRFTHFAVAVSLSHAGHNRLAGNQITESAASGIEAKDGSDGNAIEDNDIADIHGQETQGGGVFLHGGNNNLISHNRIAHTDGMGIGIANWDDTTLSVGNVVEYNHVLDTNRTALDSGAIYTLGRSQADMQTVIAGNEIEGTGAPPRHSVGIYLDDSSSGVAVLRNLVRDPGSDAAQIHGGSWNTIDNNIFDLGAGRPAAVLFQAAPVDTHPSNEQAGNLVRRNLILAGNPKPKVYVWLDGGAPRVDRNVYAGTAGAAQPGADAGPVRDPDAVVLQNPAADLVARNYWLGQRLAAVEVGFVPFALGQSGPRPAQEIEQRLPTGCPARAP